jgi:hypothetical protein
LTRLQKHLHLSVWHVLALVTNPIVSETPEYFHFVSHYFLNLSGKKLQKIWALGPTALALNFYSHLDSKLASDPHFYGKAVANVEAGYQSTSVFGAGCLTAQHLIHIGALCGLFPPEMLLHAEIGTTTNSYYKYFKLPHNPSQSLR